MALEIAKICPCCEILLFDDFPANIHGSLNEQPRRKQRGITGDGVLALDGDRGHALHARAPADSTQSLLTKAVLDIHIHPKPGS